MPSLNWRLIGLGLANRIIGIVTLGADGGTFYALDENRDIWERNSTDSNAPWKKFGDAPKDLASRAVGISFYFSGPNPDLYAATIDNRLVRSNNWPPNANNWHVTGHAYNVVAMTNSWFRPYVATRDGLLWTHTQPHKWDAVWNNIGVASNLITMAAYGHDDITGRLFAATQDGRIFWRDALPKAMRWVQIDAFPGVETMVAGRAREYDRPDLGVQLFATRANGTQLWVVDLPADDHTLWATVDRGRIRPSEGSKTDFLIDYEIEHNVILSNTVEFVLILGPGITWKKILSMPNGQDIVAEGVNGVGRSFLWPNQLQNGQHLTFKQGTGFFDAREEVYSLGHLDGISPGSRVTFTWLKD